MVEEYIINCKKRLYSIEGEYIFNYKYSNVKITLNKNNKIKTIMIEEYNKRKIVKKTTGKNYAVKIKQ